MKARSIMTSPPVVVPPDMSIAEAIELLKHHRINGAPVVDDSGTLQGIVTEADLMRVETPTEPTRGSRAEDPISTPRKVADAMTTQVFTVSPTIDVPFLARAMLDRHLKTIPVVENDRVIGVVSRRDVLGIFVRSDDDIRSEVQELLNEEIVALGRFEVTVQDGVVHLAGLADRAIRRLVERLVRSVAGVVDVDSTEVKRVRRREFTFPR